MRSGLVKAAAVDAACVCGQQRGLRFGKRSHCVRTAHNVRHWYLLSFNRKVCLHRPALHDGKGWR